VGRPLGSGGPLGPAHVADASGADPAVGPFLGRRPLDGVVSILAIVDKGPPLAFGFTPAPNVVDDNSVAMLLVKTSFLEKKS